MDVLIARSGDPYIDGGSVWVNFLAIGKQNGNTLQIGFRVPYVWGLTDQQKKTGILNAAAAAKTAYETAHGITLPAVGALEILL